MIAVEMCLITFFLMIKVDLTTFLLKDDLFSRSFFLQIISVLNFSVGQSVRT